MSPDIKHIFHRKNPESRERRLGGKVGLVTGGERGIGAEISKELALRGADIVIVHRDPQKVKREHDVEETLKEAKVLGKFVVADLTKEEDRQHLLEVTKKTFGKVNLLILSAANSTTELNVTANNLLVSALLPIMPPDSKIVYMQSVPGHFYPDLKENEIPKVYAATAKAKFLGEKSLRDRMGEFEEKGINFIVVCPPEVPNTSVMDFLRRKDRTVSEKHAELSIKYEFLKTVTKEEVGKRVGELMVEELPMEHIEFFPELKSR